MTERQKFHIAETKEFVFARDGYQCATCGRSIYHFGFPQMAHCIASTEANIKKYGKEVIHHAGNLRAVCCLRCNDAQNIGNQPEIADALAESIRCLIRQESLVV
jgi:hypothetical protein